MHFFRAVENIWSALGTLQSKKESVGQSHVPTTQVGTMVSCCVQKPYGVKHTHTNQIKVDRTRPHGVNT